MKPLLLDMSLPTFSSDISAEMTQISQSGELPALDGSDALHDSEVKLWHILVLVKRSRLVDAALAIDTLIFDEESASMPALYRAWLWLARMNIFIEKNDNSMGVTAAENALRIMAEIDRKKSDDFLAVLAGLLYNLAIIHNLMLDNSRAAKELTKAQQLLERLAKKNNERFSAMLLRAVEASTLVIKSKVQQMNVFAHYQATTELYTTMVNNGTKDALSSLVDSLKKEGDIMMQMGNGRDAVKYYTKALRFHKQINDTMEIKELRLSVCLAKALLRLINRRSAAEQLLSSLLPMARRLGAIDDANEIEELLKNKTKTSSIMAMLKSYF